MDPDEALARQLQAAELAAAGSQAPGGQNAEAQLVGKLQSVLETVKGVENPALQARARALMPLDTWRKEVAEELRLLQDLGAAASSSSGSMMSEDDLIAQKLLHWFKHSFFKWVDPIKCDFCGSSSTRPDGMAQPSSEDLRHGAGRVELHRCATCGNCSRFPRYNDVGKLLEPACRRGRCGEWANTFLLFCRAAGLTARYVVDWGDHVWTEMWSHRQARWVHMDSCEAIWDQPLLYEVGWGKKLSYVVAVGVWGATDVTRRYTRKWPEVLGRRQLVSEAGLARQLAALTARLRVGWPQPKALVWLGRDLRERLELAACTRAVVSPADLALPGRTTGSEDWRRARGEDGATSTTGSGAPSGNAGSGDGAGAGGALKGGTPYVSAGDAALPPLFVSAGRLVGGAVRAAGHNGPGETAVQAFDGRLSTKWLDFGGGGLSGSSWLEYRLPRSVPPAVLTQYDLASANDCPERDPLDWTIEGLPEQATSIAEDNSAGAATAGAVAAGGQQQQQAQEVWVVLDRRQAQRFPSRFQLRSFALAAPSPPCRAFRLRISRTADPRTANSVQLACWNLYQQGQPGGASNSSTFSSSGSTFSEQVVSVIKSIPSSSSSASSSSASSSAAASLTAPAPAARSLLERVITNLLAHPLDAKYRRLRAAKVPGLTGDASALRLLLALGFRPLYCAAEAAPAGGGGGGEDVFLVVDGEREGLGGDLSAALTALQALAGK